ncbi:hypothetical protein MESS4_830474 [Mesorhizobium sp. STM 4661]|nr:hypothetical protein MESS4_830474 [Mesorhizobium sp. STM 4661]
MSLQEPRIKARNSGVNPPRTAMWNIFLLAVTLAEKRLPRTKRCARAFLLLFRARA